MATKLPGFSFSSYKQIAFYASIIVSQVQYYEMLYGVFANNTAWQAAYEEMVAGYNFTDNVPKASLYVYLASNISDSRRNYITNGLKAYFNSQTTILVDSNQLLTTIDATLSLLILLVAVVGFVALILTFFLLLISTNQNIKENVWELGVLRAIGLSQQQSNRIFMYEAFSVVLCAILLGLTVGLIVAIALTAQFYLFIELPFSLTFPTWLFLMMVVIVIVTTFLAVYLPVADLGKKRIAVILKGNA
mmetsp:Transcript_3667/g.2738  ORF Transcript_3667/g.2738 Transcript_3667/m.2738 type:complete len:247 (+) Transcript_3667:1190-1930(+)